MAPCASSEVGGGSEWRESLALSADRRSEAEIDPIEATSHLNPISYYVLIIYPLMDRKFYELFQWLLVVTIAILYNLVFVVGRSVFWELSKEAPHIWFILDYTADCIYILDTILHAHEGKNRKIMLSLIVRSFLLSCARSIVTSSISRGQETRRRRTRELYGTVRV